MTNFEKFQETVATIDSVADLAEYLKKIYSDVISYGDINDVSVSLIGDGSRHLNPDVLKSFWFITVLQIPDINKDGICNVANQRCWGFYTDKESAIMALHSNATDMYEGIYNYAVLEEYYEGISNCNTQNRQFFEYNKERDGYFEIEKPSIFKHWSGFALG